MCTTLCPLSLHPLIFSVVSLFCFLPGSKKSNILCPVYPLSLCACPNHLCNFLSNTLNLKYLSNILISACPPLSLPSTVLPPPAQDSCFFVHLQAIPKNLSISTELSFQHVMSICSDLPLCVPGSDICNGNIQIFYSQPT